jgi:hypothetical protein
MKSNQIAHKDFLFRAEMKLPKVSWKILKVTRIALQSPYIDESLRLIYQKKSIKKCQICPEKKILLGIESVII